MFTEVVWGIKEIRVGHFSLWMLSKVIQVVWDFLYIRVCHLSLRVFQEFSTVFEYIRIGHLSLSLFSEGVYGVCAQKGWTIGNVGVHRVRSGCSWTSGLESGRLKTVLVHLGLFFGCLISYGIP